MRSWLLRFTVGFEKYMFIIIPCTLVLGILLSDQLIHYVTWSPYLFGYVTFVMALGCGLRHLKEVVQRPAPMLVTLFFRI
ncbi:hypothetical protein M3231_09475 [Neobacillus mesonae]|nr:hypothetical protein [Neobacillus mesonae]